MADPVHESENSTLRMADPSRRIEDSTRGSSIPRVGLEILLVIQTCRAERDRVPATGMRIFVSDLQHRPITRRAIRTSRISLRDQHSR